MIEILTTLLVLLTGYYAWTTNRILKANEDAVQAVKEQNEAISRPYVQATIGLLVDTPIYVLTIKNHGQTMAKNLELSIDRDFYSMGRKKLNELPAFNQIIESFPPQAEFNFWLGTGAEIHKGEEDPEGFTIEIKYEYSNKKVNEKTMIDFRPFLWSDMPRHHVAHAIKDLTEKVAGISKKL